MLQDYDFKAKKPDKKKGVHVMEGGTAHLTTRCPLQKCLYITSFIDLEHFWETGNSFPATTGESSSRKDNDDDDWSGTENWEEAYHRGIHGWPEGVEKMRDVLKLVQAEQYRFACEEEEESYDVFGDEVDIGRFVNGVPECMFTTSTVETQDGSHIKLSANVSASWIIKTEAIMNRGSAVCSLVSKLEREGYTVELISYEVTGGCWGNDQRSIIEVPIKRPEDYLNEERVSMALGNSAMLRRGCFAAAERMPKGVFEEAYGSGYGTVTDLTEDEKYIMGYTYNMDGMKTGSNDGEPDWLTATPTDIAEWVNKKWVEIVEGA